LWLVSLWVPACIRVLKMKTTSPGFFFFFLTERSTLLKQLRAFVLKQNTAWYHLWLGKTVAIMTPDAECAKFILTNREYIQKNPSPAALPTMREWNLNNLVFSEGDNWRKQRTVFNPAFGRESYKVYLPIFSQVIEKALKIIDDHEAATPGADLDIHPLTYKLTLDLLGESIFHHNFGLLDGSGDKHYKAYDTLLTTARRSLLWRFFGEYLERLPLQASLDFKAAHATISALFHEMIEDRKKNPNAGRSDVLDFIIGAHNDGTLTDAEVFGNFWILFLAGHDTTASALMWHFYCLAKFPECQEKIYQEVIEAVGKDRPITYEDLSKFKYTDNFISEVLRYYPPVTILPTRTTTKDVTVEGVLIPGGTLIGVDIYSLHHSPQYWENPEEFNPDRFTPENSKGRHKFAYLPFSLGKRECLGNNFSLQEQVLFLAMLVRKYSVHPPKNSPFADLQSKALFFQPATNFVSFQPRK